MDGRLRNMTAVYLLRGSRVLLLYRQGGRVVNDVWTGSAGGHFERDELNDARACVLREEDFYSQHSQKLDTVFYTVRLSYRDGACRRVTLREDDALLQNLCRRGLLHLT